ncbi:DUF1636 family protein [Marivibrio halodurans]|uniref:DUF1636 family protein n=1 Tax=Marivibrio halodurans TaxID=2039722 RepID=A0A8J7V1W5_9PROT|nr:DUF1636 family protein [Marivibrio halodurans]MBP5856242.1 DUF1636 family protein [Marivibrio halodurans]
MTPPHPDRTSRAADDGHRILVCGGCPHAGETRFTRVDLADRLRAVLSLNHANGLLASFVPVRRVTCLKACLFPNAILIEAPGKASWGFGGIASAADIDAFAAFVVLYVKNTEGLPDRAHWPAELRDKPLPWLTTHRGVLAPDGSRAR